MSFPFELHSAVVSDSHLPCQVHVALIVSSDHAVLLKATAQHDLQDSACGLPARFRLSSAATRSSTKIVIVLTTIHNYDCKKW